MKKPQIIKNIFIFMSIICLMCVHYNCTSNMRTKTFGGKEEIVLKTNEKLINITWKVNNLWVLTEDTTTHIKYFRENSSWGIWQGEIVVK